MGGAAFISKWERGHGKEDDVTIGSVWA